MTTTTLKTVTSVTLKARDLRRLLTNASLFASKDSTLPGICLLRFDWHEDHLYVVATNRYVLSKELAEPVSDNGGRTAFSLSTYDVKRLLAVLPKSARPADEATLTYDPETGKVAIQYWDYSMVAEEPDAEFPRWQPMFAGFTPGEHRTKAFNPEYMGLLCKVDGGYKNAPVNIEFGERDRPCRVTIGERFTALICPVRNVG